MKADGSVYQSRLEGDSLRLCYLDGDVVDCWTYSLGTNTWAPHDRHPFAPAEAAPPVRVAGSTITACKADGSDCRSIPFSPPPTADETAEAWVNADRSVVALLVGGKPIRVLDGAGKQLSVIRGWPTAMSEPRAPAMFRQVRFVGAALAAYIADTPVTSAIRLFDPRTGKKLGDINAGKPMSDSGEPVNLGPDLFAFVEFDTSAIVVHDVKRARLVRTYTIEGAEPAGFSTIVLAPDGKSLIAAQGTRIFRLDLATGNVGRFPAPVCPS